MMDVRQNPSSDLSHCFTFKSAPGEDHLLCDTQLLGMIFLAAAGPYDALRIALCHGQHADGNAREQDILRDICADAMIRLGTLISDSEHLMDRFQGIQMLLQLLVPGMLAVDEGLVIAAEA